MDVGRKAYFSLAIARRPPSVPWQRVFSVGQLETWQLVSITVREWRSKGAREWGQLRLLETEGSLLLNPHLRSDVQRPFLFIWNVTKSNTYSRRENYKRAWILGDRYWGHLRSSLQVLNDQVWDNLNSIVNDNTNRLRQNKHPWVHTDVNKITEYRSSSAYDEIMSC